MSSEERISDSVTSTTMQDEPDAWVMVAKSKNNDLQNYSLVLSAIGIDHQLDTNAGVILVQRQRSERAMFELQTFREENRDWPPPPNYVRQVPRTDNPPTLLMMGGLIIFYMITGSWFTDNPWFLAGAIDSNLILQQGQWYRLLTALTLHADQMHLVGNCVIGGFMVHLLCKTVGFGTGWLVLMLSAMAGNLMNIVLRDTAHYSVGFSTAVFAAIGIVCGRQLSRRNSTIIRQLVLPLGAGAGLLAMLGSAGERTDFGAHLFGLASGLGCGLLLQVSGFDMRGDQRNLQQLLFTLAVILIVFCWLMATVL